MSSPSEPDRRHSRSRSPRRTKSSKAGGIKWKEKSSRGEGDAVGDARLERGYRHDRDGYREREEHRRERDGERDGERDRERDHRRDARRRDDHDGERRRRDDGSRYEDDRRRHGRREEGRRSDHDRVPREENETEESAVKEVQGVDTHLPADAAPDEPAQAAVDDDIARKFGASAASKFANTKKTIPANGPSASEDSSSAAKSANSSSAKPNQAPTAPAGTMIVVKVNDRLGNSTKVPCLPTDSVGDFKKLVAMRIGRKPHEIMLKRQSERPFKDFLQLVDYGVSDGVQLDLELDTGD